jgi:two-component system alkaline phosphatase synthesis response regulator PhoP
VPGRILVVDDDDAALELVSSQLRRAGYTVVTASGGVAAIHVVRTEPPDLVILELALPDMDGFETCRRLRRERDLPLMILSARDDEIDRVVAFELGVDDYLTKPFSLRELVGRVKAILRRVGARKVESASALRVGPFAIDFETYQVTVAGRQIELTPTEFQLLKLLAQHPKRVFPRAELIAQVIGPHYRGDPRTIDVHIRHLRAKLRDGDSELPLIMTVRGTGYRFVSGND